MRHFSFAIGGAERDRWLQHTRAAVAELDPSPEVADALLEYFDMGARSGPKPGLRMGNACARRA
jgi:truncated hemoglobin YjbI